MWFEGFGLVVFEMLFGVFVIWRFSWVCCGGLIGYCFWDGLSDGSLLIDFLCEYVWRLEDFGWRGVIWILYVFVFFLVVIVKIVVVES